MLGDRRTTDDLPTINLTPMVDVVLCLLIFFMAATRLYDWDDSQFDVRTPTVADASPMTARPEDLTLTILEPGVVAVGEQRYDLAALSAMLEAARASYEDQGVLVRGDAGLPFQDLADVLSACEAAGIGRVALLTRIEENDDTDGPTDRTETVPD